VRSCCGARRQSARTRRNCKSGGGETAHKRGATAASNQAHFEARSQAGWSNIIRERGGRLSGEPGAPWGRPSVRCSTSGSGRRRCGCVRVLPAPLCAPRPPFVLPVRVSPLHLGFFEAQPPVLPAQPVGCRCDRVTGLFPPVPHDGVLHCAACRGLIPGFRHPEGPALFRAPPGRRGCADAGPSRCHSSAPRCVTLCRGGRRSIFRGPDDEVAQDTDTAPGELETCVTWQVPGGCLTGTASHCWAVPKANARAA
jgi:hypothetical protein